MLSNFKHPTYRSSDNYVHTSVQKFARRRSAFHLKILVGRGLGKFLRGGVNCALRELQGRTGNLRGLRVLIPPEGKNLAGGRVLEF